LLGFDHFLHNIVVGVMELSHFFAETTDWRSGQGGLFTGGFRPLDGVLETVVK
jgi:hypothetical protein